MGACRKCGEVNPPRAVFCMKCGVRLDFGELRPDARKPVTILFNDVTHSTRLGEQLEPETVRSIMSRYWRAVAAPCERHGGAVEKFIGDAVMAVFGIPVAKEDHALRGLRAAIEVRESIEALNDELERELGLRLETRTGLNSGEVVAGDPSGGQALATGDPVNVAARLEQAAAPGEILIGDETRRLAHDAIEAEPVDPLVVKGRDEPVLAWRLLDVSSRAGQPLRRHDAPMLGRELELTSLREALAAAIAGRSARRAVVLGPAGIGKSRLARELSAAAGEDARVLFASCPPYGEGVAFQPLADLVQQAAGEDRGQAGGEDPRAALEAILADEPHAQAIAERVAQAAGLAEAVDAGRELPWAVRRFFETLARERPLVLVVDDVHWAEEPLLDLLEHVSDQARNAQLLVVLLAREELAERRPDWAAETSRSTALRLEPLSEPATKALVVDLAGDEPLAEGALDALVERSEGNPLFVEQMLALWREQGAARDAGTIPPTIQALLAARLDRLTVEQTHAVGAAAVVGREFWPEAVVALATPEEAPRMQSTLEALVGKELLAAGRAPLVDEDGFAFRHALIRDAAYESLPKDGRAELHERFGTWMEGRYPERAEELAAVLGHHLEQAHRYRLELRPEDERTRSLARRAAKRLSTAGLRAGRAREDAVAADLLSRAEGLLPGGAPERLELLPAIAASLEGTANHARAGELYEQALAAAVEAGAVGVEGRARLGRAHVWFVAEPERPSAEIVEEAERAIALLDEAGDDRGLAEAWRLVGEARMYEGRAGDGQRALEQALGRIDADQSPRGVNAVSFALAMCLIEGPAPLGEAAAYARERLAFARARGLRSFEADMLHVLGAAEARRGRFQEGRAALDASSAMSEELGLRYMAQWSRRTLGHLELAAGDPAAAEAVLRWSYDVLDEMGLKGSLGETVVPLADALHRQGRDQEAESLLDAVREEWASGDASIEAPRLCVRAKLFAARGWDEHAERGIRRALRLVERTDWACLRVDTLAAQAEVLERAGRGEDAVPVLREAIGIARRKEYEAGALAAAAHLDALGAGTAGGVRP